MRIDGKDIYTTWGVILLEGSYSPLLKYPKRKAVKYSNYAERDGITPDLRKIEFEPKSVSLNFLIKHNSVDEFWVKYQTFFADMTSVGYRTLDLENGLIFSLRFDKSTSHQSPKLYNAGQNITVFTLSFIEDNHSIPKIYVPIGGNLLTGYYEINGIDFSSFGVHPDGEIGEVLKYPDVKEPFTDGQTFDLNTRRLKHKDITISLWMLAESETEFINNYSAFFNQFNQKGKLSLYIKEIGGMTYCYYRDCTSYLVYWGKRIGVKFSLALTIPVVTWLNGTTTILTVLQDPLQGFIADEKGRIITFNR